ncbi:hypothetical protein [Siansivirga zeaxanthinifaciens]|uniref:Uncharacterized protein n=1 Tax=Siansivirga zeaxanthinifaciens CC-SAMT-1 TaxID=1454006 RepID=A0A0C5WPJ7_9FLAO|nr:hypothetical protein [Siansivirga zeaxanthinifaciens]AJR04840.1 hypothetical protein AW14_06835 [Siansivirga zeaxanthinifaciens CC-SAMT-1]
MKTILKKPNVTTIVASMLLAIVIIFTTACETENITQGDYADAEYLDLEFYDKNRRTAKDYEKIFEAIRRFDAKNINGFYQLKETTPEELNISPKLFKHVTYLFNYTNRARNSTLYESSKGMVRLKSGDFEDQDPRDPYCAAYCVSKLSFWTSFNKAKNYSDEQYGIGFGVPPDKMDEYIDHFLPNYKVGTSVSDLQQATSRKAIVTFGRRNDNGVYDPIGHAAIFLNYDEVSGIAIVEDANTGNSELVLKEDIAKIYYKE